VSNMASVLKLSVLPPKPLEVSCAPAGFSRKGIACSGVPGSLVQDTRRGSMLMSRRTSVGPATTSYAPTYRTMSWVSEQKVRPERPIPGTKPPC
jgi:hypothetical protein